MAALNWIKEKVAKQPSKACTFYDIWKKYKRQYKSTTVEDAVHKTKAELLLKVIEGKIDPETIARQILDYVKSSKIISDQ